MSISQSQRSKYLVGKGRNHMTSRAKNEPIRTRVVARATLALTVAVFIGIFLTFSLSLGILDKTR